VVTYTKEIQMQNSKINEFRERAKPLTLEGYVLVWGNDGDGTSTDIVGASCGTRFPIQYDTVWPFLFATAADAKTYMALLEEEAETAMEGMLVVPIGALKINRKGTQELAGISHA
jgi:hypothetical protein